MRERDAPAAPQTLWQIFAMPILLALASLMGLVSALAGEGPVWDAVSWVTLGAAVLISAWYGLPWRRPGR